MGELDDDPDEDVENKHDEWQGEDENVKEEDLDNASERISNASNKRNIRDVARKLWLAVEVGDKLGVLKIL